MVLLSVLLRQLIIFHFQLELTLKLIFFEAVPHSFLTNVNIRSRAESGWGLPSSDPHTSEIKH